MQCYPVTWPLGIGQRFKGIYNRVSKEYTACKDFLWMGRTTTGCPLERIHNQWKEQHKKVHGQLQQLQGRVSHEFEVCHAYWIHNQNNTGCSVELAQIKFEEIQALLFRQRTDCYSYWLGEEGTDCLLEHAKKQWVEHRGWTRSKKAADSKMGLQPTPSLYLNELDDKDKNQLQQENVVALGSRADPQTNHPEHDQHPPDIEDISQEVSPWDPICSSSFSLIC